MLRIPTSVILAGILAAAHCAAQSGTPVPSTFFGMSAMGGDYPRVTIGTLAHSDFAWQSVRRIGGAIGNLVALACNQNRRRYGGRAICRLSRNGRVSVQRSRAGFPQRRGPGDNGDAGRLDDAARSLFDGAALTNSYMRITMRISPKHLLCTMLPLCWLAVAQTPAGVHPRKSEAAAKALRQRLVR